jgi:hypothetical protein
MDCKDCEEKDVLIEGLIRVISRHATKLADIGRIINPDIITETRVLPKPAEPKEDEK